MQCLLLTECNLLIERPYSKLSATMAAEQLA